VQFNFTPSDIASVGTLFGIVLVLAKIIFGQGKAKQREENFVEKYDDLKKQDEEFKGEIKIIKTDVSDIKITQEKHFGLLSTNIKDMENNFLREIKKINGR